MPAAAPHDLCRLCAPRDPGSVDVPASHGFVAYVGPGAGVVNTHQERNHKLFQGVSIKAFLGDEFFATDTAQQALQVKAAWVRWSSLMGLRDNLRTKLYIWTVGENFECPC